MKQLFACIFYPLFVVWLTILLLSLFIIEVIVLTLKFIVTSPIRAFKISLARHYRRIGDEDLENIICLRL